MRKSTNCIDLMSMACDRVAGKFGKALLGTLCFVGPLLAILMASIIIAPLFNIYWLIAIAACVDIALFGPMEIGYIRFMRKLSMGEKVCVGEIYKHFNTFPVAFMIAVSMTLIYFVCSMLLVFPLIIALMFYSMIWFVVERYNTKTVSEGLQVTKNLIARNRTSMMAYKSLFYLLYVLLFTVFGGVVVWTVLNMSKGIALAVTACVITCLLVILLYAIITVFFHYCNTVLFDEAIERKEAEIGMTGRDHVEEKVESKQVFDTKVEEISEENAQNTDNE